MNTSSGSSRRSASTALHVVIADQLREQISSGQLAIGASLPSEADLMRSFGVSRGPVRQAVAALRSEGLIAVSRGRPPRVIGTVASQPLANFLSFSEWAKSAHRTPGQKTVETARRPVSPAAADALELEAGEPVVEVLRVRSCPTLIRPADQFSRTCALAVWTSPPPATPSTPWRQKKPTPNTWALSSDHRSCASAASPSTQAAGHWSTQKTATCPVL